MADLNVQANEIATMSLEQMAGQRVIYSYRGLSPPPDLLTAISQGEVGGVIFFSSNISSPAQLSGVIAQLNSANASPGNPAHDYPLLLMTDQEGGLVKRLPWAGPSQSEAQIGASAHPVAAASAAGSQAADGLHAVGINVDLAPVLDVYRQPGDFDDQYHRSYSMNPNVAAAAGAAFVRAQQAGGVQSTVKHFPGLGPAAAAQNTDNGPVTISLPAAALRSVDEAPYQPSIQAGVGLAMVSWAKYPALDPRVPAGLSPTIIQGDLQGRARLQRGDDHRRARRGRPRRLRVAGEQDHAGRQGGHGRAAVHGNQPAARPGLRDRAGRGLCRWCAAADRVQSPARPAARAAGKPR